MVRLDDSISAAAASSSKAGNSLNETPQISDKVVTIRLTKDQHQAVKIICDVYQQPVSEYIEDALVQTMKADIEDGNLSIALLERLDESPQEGKNEKSKIDNKRVQNSDPILDELIRLNQRTPKQHIS